MQHKEKVYKKGDDIQKGKPTGDFPEEKTAPAMVFQLNQCDTWPEDGGQNEQDPQTQKKEVKERKWMIQQTIRDSERRGIEDPEVDPWTLEETKIVVEDVQEEAKK